MRTRGLAQFISLLLAVAAAGCSSKKSSGGTSGSGGSGAGGAAGVGGAGTGGASGSGGTGAGGKVGTGGTGAGGKVGTGGTGAGGAVGGASGTGGDSGACLGASLLTALGANTVLVGGAMTDATAKLGPFDGRYLYLSGGLFDGSAPCSSCASGCTTGGSSCANANPAGCAWWGCWQWDQDPPGQYVAGFVTVNEQASWQNAARPQIPMFTYYEELQTSKLAEGTAQVAALNDATFLTRYLADWRFVVQQIGTHRALLHIEPDFWGYVEQLNADPHAVPAKVTTAAPTDCAGYENSASGLARCMIHIVRAYAPNARVGLHASAWGTSMDVFGNSDAGLNVAAEAQKISAFLTALGAKDGDFIVTDFSDRDAGYYQSIGRNTWWDATNATLPSFHQALAWTKAVAEDLALPAIVWQIPVGNMNLDNTTDHWRDNRLDYLFAHMDEVAAAHIVGLFFGAGAGGMTTPETDGGNFVARTTAYRAAGGRQLCP